MTAIEFQASHRGKFIQAQALYYAIQKLSEVPGVMREVSNIADMHVNIQHAMFLSRT